MNDTIQTRRADIHDGRRIAQTMTVAFQADPVSTWLMPDPDDRARRHPAFFRAFVDHCITWGEVQITTDYQATALWLDVDPRDNIDPGDSKNLFKDALGPYYSRWQVLDALMRARHTERVRHAYLLFAAVVPQHQGKGIGGQLLANKLDELDKASVPAYLEASSERSTRLYERLGFSRMSSVIELPGGPTMYPMWRAPCLVAA